MSDSKECIKELNEKDLDKIQGGMVDWKIFSSRFLEYVLTNNIEMTLEYKELIELIKTKDWINVAIKALPLAAKDPMIARLINECEQ